MKSNAHLYLPWSVIAEWAASKTCPAVSLHRSLFRGARIEKLDGGCDLYRLIPTATISNPAVHPAVS